MELNIDILKKRAENVSNLPITQQQTELLYITNKLKLLLELEYESRKNKVGIPTTKDLKEWLKKCSENITLKDSDVFYYPKEDPFKLGLKVRYPKNIDESLALMKLLILPMNIYYARTNDWDLALFLQQEPSMYWFLISNFVCEKSGVKMATADFQYEKEGRVALMVMDAFRVFGEFLKAIEIDDYLKHFAKNYNENDIIGMYKDIGNHLQPYLDKNNEIKLKERINFLEKFYNGVLQKASEREVSRDNYNI